VDYIVWDVELIICTARWPGEISAFFRTVSLDRLLFLAPLTALVVQIFMVREPLDDFHPSGKGVGFIIGIRGFVSPHCYG